MEEKSVHPTENPSSSVVKSPEVKGDETLFTTYDEGVELERKAEVEFIR